MPEFQINYLAVGGAALATIFIGALWYSPLLFGDRWAKAHGYSEEQLKENFGRAFIVSLFCYVVMAFVLAVLISYTGVSTVPQGAFLGLLVWVGFLAGRRVVAKCTGSGHQITQNTLAPLSAAEQKTFMKLLARLAD